MSLPLVVIAGPTAVGKSDIAVELALRFNGEIISADSVQLYKYFNIGAAKLTNEEQKGIPHHLFDILEPDQPFSVADYQKLARKKIQEINERGKLPFLVGGTGLYIQAVIDPFEFPETTGHEEIRKNYEKYGLKAVRRNFTRGCRRSIPMQPKEFTPTISGGFPELWRFII